MTSPLQKILRLWTRNRASAPPAKRTPISRRGPLAFDHLEDRCVPATLTVSDVSADSFSDDASLSLREAIDLINRGGTSFTGNRSPNSSEIVFINETNPFGFNDTIQFVSSASGKTLTLTMGEMKSTNNIQINGPAGGLTINAAGSSRIFLFTDDNDSNLKTVSLSNLNLTGGSTATGGAIFSREDLTITSCALFNNFTGSGGGAITSAKGILTIVNSTISGNTTNGDGGGILVAESAFITNSTITNNRADADGNGGAGGGINDVPSLFSFRELKNSIVAGNFVGAGSTANDLAGIGMQLGGNPSSNNLIGVDFLNTYTGQNNNIVGVSPNLAPLVNNGGPSLSHALLSNSAARNAGSAANIPSGIVKDQRGLPRSVGIVDIGAVEMTNVAGPYVVDITTDAVDGNYGAGQLSLREAVILANDRTGSDAISFASALNGQTITLLLGEVPITDSVTITGNVNPIKLAGNNRSRIFNLNDNNAGLQQPVTLSSLVFNQGNAAGTGFGGAISNSEFLTLLNVTVSGNQANNGGGVSNTGTLTITNSTISGNSSLNAGGGLYSDSGTMTLANSTVSGNTASGFGGGIYNQGLAHITNATIAGNRTTGGSGGGVFYGFSGQTNIYNTIVAGNFFGGGTSPSDLEGAAGLAGSNNLIGDAASAGNFVNNSNGNFVGNNGSGVRPIATILDATLRNNGGQALTHSLVQNSIALGRASNSVPNFAFYDQREAARDPGSPDIGAYEVQHPLSPVGVPATAFRTFAPHPNANANTAFITGLYQSALLREPDAAGLANWLALLNGGALNRTQIALNFVNSVENRGNQVTFFYKYFLGRTPDSVGRDNWIAVLRGGADEGTVITGFILSPEFAGLNNNTSFVNLMYYALLGRDAETTGFNNWKNALDTNALSRAQVVSGFLRSTESLARIVHANYLSYLKRQADPSSISGFTSFLVAGNTIGSMTATLLGSPEFFSLASANL